MEVPCPDIGRDPSRLPLLPFRGRHSRLRELSELLGGEGGLPQDFGEEGYHGAQVLARRLDACLDEVGTGGCEWAAAADREPGLESIQLVLDLLARALLCAAHEHLRGQKAD